MKEIDSLFIERSECNNCCRCLRECSQKAVVFTGEGLSIDSERCVSCGRCYGACKTGAVKVRDDVHLARKLVKTESLKVAALSPGWINEFDGISESRLAEALKLLGFDYVTDTSSAHELGVKMERRIASRNNGIYISVRCPAVREYIEKYRPRFAGSLFPVASDMILSGRMIKEKWGEGVKTVYFTSCASAKKEVLDSDEVDQVLTYKELKRWLRNDGIRFDKIAGATTYSFESVSACNSGNTATDGCGTSPIEISENTWDNIGLLLERAPSVASDYSVLLKLYACNSGCVGSPLSTADKKSLLEKRISEFRKKELTPEKSSPVRISAAAPEKSFQPVNRFVPESETLSALDDLGLSTAANQTDCNGCGYGTCRRFAKALSKKLVDKKHCVRYLENEGTVKFRSLLDKLSSGVAIVGPDMKIEEANRTFAVMLGPEAEYLYDKSGGFEGLESLDVIPFSTLLSAVLENGDETVVRDVQVKGQILTVSIHTLQKFKRILVICRSMVFAQVRNQEIISRTRKVIDENLETVQKIAFLLGENASRTEAMLSSILNAQLREDAK